MHSDREYVLYAKKTKIILQNGTIGWHWGDELLNKVIVLAFFAYKNYYRSFIKLPLNPWCHMDYFTDLLATFLDVDGVNYIAVYGRVRELSECIRHILICVLKTNKAVYRFGTTWG